MKKALFILVDGFEEIEAVAPMDILTRGGVFVKKASLNSEYVTGSHNITINCESVLSEMEEEICQYDAIILSGGPGTFHYEESELLKKTVTSFFNDKKLVGAICAAPTILAKWGILKRGVCFPSAKSEMNNAEYINENVVVDKNIITSKSAGTALDFGYSLLEYLEGKEVSDDIKNQMYYKI